jgi:hypothetical protein
MPSCAQRGTKRWIRQPSSWRHRLLRRRCARSNFTRNKTDSASLASCPPPAGVVVITEGDPPTGRGQLAALPETRGVCPSNIQLLNRPRKRVTPDHGRSSDTGWHTWATVALIPVHDGRTRAPAPSGMTRLRPLGSSASFDTREPSPRVLTDPDVHVCAQPVLPHRSPPHTRGLCVISRVCLRAIRAGH